VRLPIHLTPGAGADRIEGIRDGRLRARVAARPVDGAANEALLRLLAAELGLSRRRLAIRSGASIRTKIVQVDGIDPATVRSRWPGVDV
jgi:uncharacterized protein YggU (UPF0235/DUF167 family)